MSDSADRLSKMIKTQEKGLELAISQLLKKA